MRQRPLTEASTPRKRRFGRRDGTPSRLGSSMLVMFVLYVSLTCSVGSVIITSTGGRSGAGRRPSNKAWIDRRSLYQGYNAADDDELDHRTARWQGLGLCTAMRLALGQAASAPQHHDHERPQGIGPASKKKTIGTEIISNSFFFATLAYSRLSFFRLFYYVCRGYC